jgi:hypothetical protein
MPPFLSRPLPLTSRSNSIFPRSSVRWCLFLLQLPHRIVSRVTRQSRPHNSLQRTFRLHRGRERHREATIVGNVTSTLLSRPSITLPADAQRHRRMMLGHDFVVLEAIHIPLAQPSSVCIPCLRGDRVRNPGPRTLTRAAQRASSATTGVSSRVPGYTGFSRDKPHTRREKPHTGPHKIDEILYFSIPTQNKTIPSSVILSKPTGKTAHKVKRSRLRRLPK